MVNEVRRYGNQVRTNPVKLKVGDEMFGTPFPREGRHGDYWKVRVKGGITGLLTGDLTSLDPNRNVRVSLKRIDEPEYEDQKRRYVFEFVSQTSSASAVNGLSPTGIDAIVAGAAVSQTAHITGKPIPSVDDRVAFRQYGEGLSRTTSRDSSQLKLRVGGWLGLAEAISPRDSAIDQIIAKLKRRVGKLEVETRRRTRFSLL